MEKLASWLVCILPCFVARWLMFGSGNRIPLPASWVPHIFERALGDRPERAPRSKWRKRYGRKE